MGSRPNAQHSRIEPEFRSIGTPRMASEIISLTEFKAKAAQVLADIKASEHTVVLTQNGRATAVVQDFESHQRLQDALLMLKLVLQAEADIAAGNTTPQAEVFADIRARLEPAE